MTKILLIGPYKNADLRSGQFFSPPNGIYRIKSFVEKKTKAKVDIIDVDIDDISTLEKAIVQNDYDIIGFSLLYPTIKNGAELIHKAKILSPNSILIAGGQGAVFLEDILLSKTPLDIIAHGFGEFAIKEIVDTIENGLTKPRDFKEIKGLSIKTPNGIIETKPRSPYTTEEFREIANSFDYSTVPYEKYWEYMEQQYSPQILEVMKNDGLLYTIRIMTSSHCPMRCSFCSATNFLEDATEKTQCAIEMSVEDIINSMKKAIAAHPKVNAFYFVDDNLLQNTERAAELCKTLVKEFGTTNLNFFCLSRVDNVEPNILLLMKIAGFKLIIYGVESFSNKILKDMRKKISSDNPSKMSENAIIQTLEAGITPLINLILFYPTTTIKDITETIEKAIPLVEKGARITTFSFVEVYPGSDILKEKNLKFKFEKFSVNNQLFVLPWLIMPHDKKVKEFAISALELREQIIKKLKKKYFCKKELPHPVFCLSLFLATYKLLGKQTTRLDNLIESLMIESQEKQEIKVANYE